MAGTGPGEATCALCCFGLEKKKRTRRFPFPTPAPEGGQRKRPSRRGDKGGGGRAPRSGLGSGRGARGSPGRPSPRAPLPASPPLSWSLVSGSVAGDLGRPSRRQYQKCTCLTGRQRPPPPKLEISFAFHSLDSVSLFSSKSSLQVAPVFMWKGPPPLNPYQSGQERYWGGTDVGKCAASCSRLLDGGSPA